MKEYSSQGVPGAQYQTHRHHVDPDLVSYMNNHQKSNPDLLRLSAQNRRIAVGRGDENYPTTSSQQEAQRHIYHRNSHNVYTTVQPTAPNGIQSQGGAIELRSVDLSFGNATPEYHTSYNHRSSPYIRN